MSINRRRKKDESCTRFQLLAICFSLRTQHLLSSIELRAKPELGFLSDSASDDAGVPVATSRLPGTITLLIGHPTSKLNLATTIKSGALSTYPPANVALPVSLPLASHNEPTASNLLNHLCKSPLSLAGSSASEYYPDLAIAEPGGAIQPTANGRLQQFLSF